MLVIYRILINITLILSPLIIFLRLINKKEDIKRFKEKFCFFSEKRKNRKVIWFHGASVGEIQSIIPLLEKFEKNSRINQILLTSNTLSSSKIISKIKLKKVIHQFFPIDVNFISNNFLEYWKPSAAFFIDSETESKIQDALKALTKDKTTIVIAHRLSTILNSNNIYVIDSGKIVASGNHKTLINNSEIYKNFYEKQIQK